MNEFQLKQQQSDELQLAVRAAIEGGKIVRAGFHTEKNVQIKQKDQSLVTTIDKQTEHTITNILHSGSPYGIIGEEGTKENIEQSAVWIIDPIDGTTNFVRNISFFCVSIALVRQNQVLLGVTYQPITNACYYAELGKGAYLNGDPVNVSSTSRNLAKVVMLEHGRDSSAKHRNTILFERLGKGYTLRKFGSSALELCYVAEGITDAFISSGDQLWDFAAGIILVKEAGGMLTDWRGNEWTGDHSYILLSNGEIHQDLVCHTSDLQPQEFPEDERQNFFSW